MVPTMVYKNLDCASKFFVIIDMARQVSKNGLNETVRYKTTRKKTCANVKLKNFIFK